MENLIKITQELYNISSELRKMSSDNIEIASRIYSKGIVLEAWLKLHGAFDEEKIQAPEKIEETPDFTECEIYNKCYSRTSFGCKNDCVTFKIQRAGF